MYRHGRSVAATEKLAEIAHKIVENKGIFEWEDRNGRPNGSPFYAGAAAVLAQALIEGYFGVRLTHESLEVAPRLGSESGRVALIEKATRRYVGYEYNFKLDTQTASLRLYTNAAVPVKFALLV